MHLNVWELLYEYFEMKILFPSLQKTPLIKHSFKLNNKEPN